MNLVMRLRSFSRNEDAQDLIEYAFLAMFIALVVTAGLTTLGNALNTQYSNIGTHISTAS